MGYRVVLQPRAERDIDEAFAYAAEQAPGAARRWYDRLLGGSFWLAAGKVAATESAVFLEVAS